jgi:hypothetical protein
VVTVKVTDQALLKRLLALRETYASRAPDRKEASA